MRKFVRHPSSIPIELAITHASSNLSPALRNIGNGGFSCAVDWPIDAGTAVQLRIPLIWPDYRGCGVVVWCRAVPPRYEIGIEFGTQDLFKTKMVEQLCQIEHYRQQVLNEEGRELNSEQAAQEWIALYAKEFSESFCSTRGNVSGRDNDSTMRDNSSRRDNGSARDNGSGRDNASTRGTSSSPQGKQSLR